MTRQPRFLWIAAVAVPLAVPAAALAETVKDTVHDPLSWECAWSVWRWLLLAGIAATAWLVAFHLWFPARLASRPDRPAPWPMDAFGSAAAAVVFAAALGFVVVFAVLSDELTRRPLQVLPGGNSAVNRNVLWFAVLLAGTAVALFLRFFVFRHRSR